MTDSFSILADALVEAYKHFDESVIFRSEAPLSDRLIDQLTWHGFGIEQIRKQCRTATYYRIRFRGDR